jgi:quercetin dioxygenase-like cupin family protein
MLWADDDIGGGDFRLAEGGSTARPARAGRCYNSAMPLYEWEGIEKEQLNPLFARQAIHGEQFTIARLDIRRGCVVPEHSHHNEQLSMIERGRLKFLMGGEEIVVGPGQALLIPPNVPHSAEALEDCVATDVFTPRREDWIRGDDAYLRR